MYRCAALNSGRPAFLRFLQSVEAGFIRNVLAVFGFNFPTVRPLDFANVGKLADVPHRFLRPVSVDIHHDIMHPPGQIMHASVFIQVPCRL
ncbi:hypothetical protein D3C76_1521700 [compost metagenome]